MSGRTRVFILSGLGLSLALALLVSPFASKAPDGLDRFAEDQQIEEHEATWAHAPLDDYQVAQVAHEGLSTGMAGAIGTLAVFGVMCVLGWTLRRRNAHANEKAEA